MDEYVISILNEKSDLAIERGNVFEGFYGKNPDEFSKEELIMLLNIVYDEMQQYRGSCNELSKRLMGSV